jgi:hypothetical protein
MLILQGFSCFKKMRWQNIPVAQQKLPGELIGMEFA